MMLRIIQIICLLITLQLVCSKTKTKDFEKIFAFTNPRSSVDIQASAALAVINRTVPQHVHLFEVTISADLPLNTFQLYKTEADDIVQIKASSGVIACKGFYHYIKYYCNSHVSWDGYRVKLPERLPSVNVSETSPSRFIYYQNVCTWSYSFAWWQWKDWQRHIDWIAMQGITLTLAPVQEIVWNRVYSELGLTQTEINDHFTGPAFFAWQRMGNIRGFAGPLSKRFMLWSSSLQKQMIASFQELGISFALPAFAGHVPKAFKRIFPNATYTELETWNRFQPEYCCSLFIDPLDPLFKTVGQLFLKKVIEEYGEGNHIYFSDPFNEMNPIIRTPDYISQVSKTIFSTMADVDENAIWLLQGWFFLNAMWTDELKRAFLTAVPTGRILALDLHSDIRPQFIETHSYYGQPFIWCMLHNFGGVLGMQGNFKVVNEQISKAKSFNGSSMVGVGITPEGINQNYVMYEFALERGWYQKPTDVMGWINNYTFSRYGFNDNHIESAWKLLKDTVFSYVGPSHHGKYVVCRRPSINIFPWTWYNLTQFDDVLDEFLNVPVDLIIDNDMYKHDLVDITRQFLQNKIEMSYPSVKAAFANKNLVELRKVRDTFESMLTDMDEILQTGQNFLLGNWLESAKALGSNQLEEQLYEYNARNQITIWGPNGEIVDYAHKQWAGVVRDYCLPRWQLFFSELEFSLEKNKGKFSDSKCRQKIFKQIEEPFTVANKMYDVEAQGDAIETARRILQKYRNLKFSNQVFDKYSGPRNNVSCCSIQ